MNLEVRDMTMDYGAVKALQSVSVAVESGEVHGLVGENGAGKSTLLKILSGVQKPTSGQVLIEGKVVAFHGVRESEEHGISMIHQELNLIDTLDISENIFLGREPKKRGLIDRPKMLEEAEAALREIDCQLSAATPVGALSLAEKQLIEIAKAVARGAKLVIMDEPTAVLAKKETEALLELVTRLRSQGTTVLYVSHRLEEIVKVCDRVTVLRDGEVVTTQAKANLTPHEIANLMVGREMSDLFPKQGTPGEEEVLKVQELLVAGFPETISFSLKSGEILGLGGLVGAGRTELAEAICGLRSIVSGTVDSGGLRIAYVSEDRKGTGLHVNLEVFENVTLPNLRAYARMLLDQKKQVASTEDWIRKLGIRVSGPAAKVSSLSGGNQQKVALAKWLDVKPGILILDEPTRGVDIGAKTEIYGLIAELAAQGMACLVISSEMNELIGLCQRVIVLRERRVMGELVGKDISEQGLMRLAAGLAA